MENNKCAERSVVYLTDISVCYRLLNCVVSYLIVTSLVVVYWYSTWNLVETVLFFPNDVYASTLASMVTGIFIYFVALSCQDYIYRLATSHGRVWLVIAVRLYIYVLAFGSVNLWKYAWRLWDKLTSTSELNGLLTFLIAFLIMACMGITLQLMEVPCAIGLDTCVSTHFNHGTYMNTKPGTWHHVVDSLFTAVLVPFLVATVWRGLWVFWDNVLEPDDLVASALYSWLISACLYIVLQLTRTSWMRLSAWTDDKFWLWKYLVEDTHTLLSAVVCITHWRGSFKLLEKFPIEAPLKYWLGHPISFLLLSFLFATNAIITRTLKRDGVQSHGEGINLNMHYVTNMMHYWEEVKTSTITSHDDSCSAGDQTGSEDVECGSGDDVTLFKKEKIELETIPVLTNDTKPRSYT